MNGYSLFVLFSLFCYSFLLISVFPYRKKSPIIGTFMELLIVMILWNGGSLAMRMQFLGIVNLWHHVSLFGMTMLALAFYHFVVAFLERRTSNAGLYWLFFYLVLFASNCLTNFFIPLPEVLTINGQTQFLYHYNWQVYLFFVPIVITIIQIILVVIRHCRGNKIAYQQLAPIVCGILILLIGHALTVLPFFTGFPIDMLSGVINTVFVFYALYRKKLFSMTILLSKYNLGYIAITLSILIFSKLASVIQNFLMRQFGLSYAFSTIAICAILLLMIAAWYLLFKTASSLIFTRTEQQLKDRLARFSEEITYMLNMEDILANLAETIADTVDLERLFILVRGMDGHYYIEHTMKQLEERNFYFRADHPLLSYFKTHNNCVKLQDFSRLTMYRSLWEKEKSLLNNLQIDSFVPLICDNDLLGFAMLSCKHGKNIDRAETQTFLQSIAEISAVAVKNAYTYEKAIEDAQKDDLTGLINFKFFFELLDREFDKNKDALSLCLMDIDDFRLYNQLYGTHEGDIALQRIAGILLASVGENGYAARIDGDEFALILPGYDIYSAKCLAENIVSQISEITSFFASDSSHKITMSIGICASPYMASTSKELYRNADTTVYTVKRTGKNAVLMYSADNYRRDTSHSSYKSGYNEHASTIYALTAAIDAKDHYTFHHSRNVAYYAAELAKAAGMSADLVEIVRESGLLHDIGKIGIREDILNKPGKLTADEYDIMKSHVENAVNIIRYLPSLDYVIPAVFSHHERYDGKGYPRRLAEDNIPITGRILSIADAFDAITSIRNYKEASSPEEAVKILRSEAGKQFDPNLVEIFVDLVESKKLEIRGLTASPSIADLPINPVSFLPQN